MAQLKGPKTHENWKHAFDGESQVNRRDLSFACRAGIERFEHPKHFSPVSVTRAESEHAADSLGAFGGRSWSERFKHRRG